MKTRKRTNKISVEHAIDLYFNQHKKELLKVFKTERRAKANMRNDVDNLPANYFKSHKQANEVFNDWYDRHVDPYKAQLKQAKRDAVNKNIWSSQRELNNRMNANDLKYSGNSLGVDSHNWDLTLTDYYEIKNSNYILGKIRAFQGHSEYEYWQYLSKDNI